MFRTFLIKSITSFLMFFYKFHTRIVFVNCVAFKSVIAIIICFRCACAQKEYRLFFLFQKCSKCIRIDKQCDFAISIVNFSSINKILEKLKREKLKIETVWKVVNEIARAKLVKLKRFRQQKKFFKNREQKIFDKNLNNVKKLKRLKFLKSFNYVKIVFIVFF